MKQVCTDITNIKVRILRECTFPVATYGCESWTISVTLVRVRGCKELNPATINAEVNALISKTSNNKYVQTDTDGSVMNHYQTAWAFIVLAGDITVQGVSWAFLAMSSNMIMETKNQQT